MSTIAEIGADLVCNPYEPPLLCPASATNPCACCPARVAIEIHYFGDGHSGGYWVCTDCARAIWRGARAQGRELQWSLPPDEAGALGAIKRDICDLMGRLEPMIPPVGATWANTLYAALDDALAQIRD